MTDLTGQQLIDAILRGMKEVGERFAPRRDIADTATSPATASEQAACGSTAQASERRPKR